MGSSPKNRLNLGGRKEWGWLPPGNLSLWRVTENRKVGCRFIYGKGAGLTMSECLKKVTAFWNIPCGNVGENSLWVITITTEDTVEVRHNESIIGLPIWVVWCSSRNQLIRSGWTKRTKVGWLLTREERTWKGWKCRQLSNLLKILQGNSLHRCCPHHLFCATVQHFQGSLDQTHVSLAFSSPCIFHFPSLFFLLGSLSPGLQLHRTFCCLYFSPLPPSLNSHINLSHFVFRKRGHMNSESIYFCSGYVYLICSRSGNTEIILDFSTVAHTHKHIQMKNALFFFFKCK